MVCEYCQQHEATIHLSQMVNGQTRELHLCEECAEENGMNVQSVMSIPELLFGMGADGSKPEDDSPAASKSCPFCHMRARDFKKHARLGCPRCYETFEGELAPMLAAMHKGPRHAGKVPATRHKGLEREARLAALKTQLAAAIGKEAFEEAARLRDQLREADHGPE